MALSGSFVARCLGAGAGRVRMWSRQWHDTDGFTVPPVANLSEAALYSLNRREEKSGRVELVEFAGRWTRVTCDGAPTDQRPLESRSWSLFDSRRRCHVSQREHNHSHDIFVGTNAHRSPRYCVDRMVQSDGWESVTTPTRTLSNTSSMMYGMRIKHWNDKIGSLGYDDSPSAYIFLTAVL
jgi:hypothetical protein